MGVGLAAFGAGIGFLGGFQRAQAENRSLDFQADLAELNASIALEEAEFTEKFAMRSELQFRVQSEQFISAQKVQAAASGFSIETGSIRELLTQSEVLAEADALAIRFKGEFEAFKSRRQAQTLGRQADIFRSSKTDPLLAGFTGAASGGSSFLK